MTVGGQGGIAPEAREDARRALAHRVEPRARRIEIVARLVDGVVAGHAALLEALLALELAREEGDALLGLDRLGERDAVLGTQRVEVAPHDRHLRVGARDRHLERRSVDAEEQLTLAATGWLSRTATSTTRPATSAVTTMMCALT